MKHLKLYEQYDFDDLSDEELFGKPEKDLKLAKLGGYYYVVYKRSKTWRNILLFDGGENDTISRNTFEDLNPPTPKMDSAIFVFKGEYGNMFTYYKWKKLPKEIKDRIDI